MKDILVILDNGHSPVTAGKRSPKLDNGERFYEWEFNNDIVNRIARRLEDINISYAKIVPENDDPDCCIDVGLSKRAARANALYKEVGRGNAIYISVHANAMGKDGEWTKAHGWSVYVAKVCSAESRYLASMFANIAENDFGYKVRKVTPEQLYWEENFTVLTKTNMPAILTENFFYNNTEDLKYLMSEEGREEIAKFHVKAIYEYIKSRS